MATLTFRVQSIPAPWRASLRAITLCGGAAFAGGLLSLISTKAVATLLGPAHLAVLGSLQQLRQTVSLVGSLNGQTGLLQGAASLQNGARREYIRTVLLLMASGSTLVSALLLFAPEFVAYQIGLAPANAAWIRWMTPVAWAGTAYVFFTSLINASGAIGSLARLQLAGPFAMTLLSVPAARIVAGSGDGWFVGLLTVCSAFAAIGAAVVCRRSVEPFLCSSERWWSTAAAVRFSSVSASLFASALLASWVLMHVRGRILQTEGLRIGGSFDAAWAISANQAGLVLASMQAFYLPALVKVPREHRSADICRMLSLAAVGGAVSIAVLSVWRAEIVRLLYSADFVTATRYLRWTLAGDYLRITSWILSLPMIASANMGAFLAADVLAYTVFATTSWGLSQRYTASDAAAMGFVAMYAAHLAFCTTWLIFRGDWRPSRRTLVTWFAGFGLVVATTLGYWQAA